MGIVIMQMLRCVYLLDGFETVTYMHDVYRIVTVAARIDNLKVLQECMSSLLANNDAQPETIYYTEALVSIEYRTVHTKHFIQFVTADYASLAMSLLAIQSTHWYSTS